MEQAVPVKTYSYRHEAELARALLELEGIESIIQGDDCGGLGIGLSFSGGVRVLVSPEDVERAVEILEKTG